MPPLGRKGKSYYNDFYIIMGRCGGSSGILHIRFFASLKPICNIPYSRPHKWGTANKHQQLKRETQGIIIAYEPHI